MLIITFLNDRTGTEQIGNYTARVRSNAQIVHEVRVEGHSRDDDWRALVRRWVEQWEEGGE